jgi:phytanoyl-CoA hydroxylase
MEEAAMDVAPELSAPLLSGSEIAQYRRDGYVVVRGLLGPDHVEACKTALTGLAVGTLPATETKLMYETGIDIAGLSPAEREYAIRKYMDFCEDSDALKAAAFSRRLHLVLDQLLGQGRVLFQEMALVKPPRIGSEKPWHQDAAYFRIKDPGLVVGVWIALDEASAMNGCMEMVPGSHLGGGVPHIHENDFNLCQIIPGKVDIPSRVAIEMQPGDALIFHGMIHHYTAPNTSNMRRRAVQYHYHQVGAVWGTVEDHQAHFHFDDGSYAGCTVPHPGLGSGNYSYRNGLPREITPVDTSA